jgi:excinuclease ABC subunit C
MKKMYKNMPDTAGVYLMKNSKAEIIYIGKAGNLKRRVSSYFLRAHDYKTERLVKEIRKIDVNKTDTAIEALILESQLIKKHRPKYNVKETDDKSFLYLEITKDKFPRVILIRGKDLNSKNKASQYGPFTSANSIRESLRILRRIFPYSDHSYETSGKGQVTRNKRRIMKACFNYQIGLCPGVCAGAISQKDYKKNIRNLQLFFGGKKERIIKSLERDMEAESRLQNYEKAEKIKRQIFALNHIQDIALIKDNEIVASDKRHATRIEGYDISNISGTSAVGAMVVFTRDKPDKNQYRKFKIKTIKNTDDTGMLREVLLRRLRRAPDAHGWPLPDLFLIDGGKPQVNVVKRVLDLEGFKIPVVGIAKGPERKKNEFIGKIPKGFDAHRFAISYHRKIRARKSVS